MLLRNLLDINELSNLITTGLIRFQRHPELPLAILNYTDGCIFTDTWPETLQKCRGLIIDTTEWDKCNIADSVVIARPFHKFFNLNHSSQPDYHENNLPKVEPTVTEKMDGWFGIQWCYEAPDGQKHYGIASRGSFTSPGALFASDRMRKFVKYGAVDEFPKGYSPIYEIIFRAGKIVVDYAFEGLVLLGCVNIETGEELPYDELQAVWAKIAGYAMDNRPWIRLVKAHRMSVDDCLTSDKTNFEGFVMTYPRPGTWPIKVKIKLDDYKRLHKLITGVTPQQIWETLHDPMVPWLGNTVPDHFRDWAVKWRDKLYTSFHFGFMQAVNLLQHKDILTLSKRDPLGVNYRRDLVSELKIIDAQYAHIALAIFDNKIYQAHQGVWDQIRPVGREFDTFYREGQGE